MHDQKHLVLLDILVLVSSGRTLSTDIYKTFLVCFAVSMAIAPALLVTQCFMLAICLTGLDVLPPMKPRLSMRPTQDITVTCQLSAFMDTHWSFHPDLLQVVRKSNGQQDWATLATLYLADGKVSASDHLVQSEDNFYVVNGRKDGRVIQNSWISISIGSVHDTSFCCQLVYADSGSPKTLRSKPFPFHTNVSNNKTSQRITVTVTEGMSLECFHKPQGTTVTETSLEIVKTETDRNLCPQLEKQNEQHLQRLCRFQNAFVGGAATKAAHMFNMSQEEGTYYCRISGGSSREVVVTSPITTTTYCCDLTIFFGILLAILLLGCICVSCLKNNNMGNTHDSSCRLCLKRPSFFLSEPSNMPQDLSLEDLGLNRVDSSSTLESFSLSEPSNMPQDLSQEDLGLNRVDSSSTLESPISCTEDQASSSNTEHSPTG